MEIIVSPKECSLAWDEVLEEAEAPQLAIVIPGQRRDSAQRLSTEEVVEITGRITVSF